LKRRKEEKERKARALKEKEEKEAEKESRNDNTLIHRSPTMETIVGVGNSLSARPVETATTHHIPPAIDISPPPIDSKGGEETATKYSFPTPKPREGGGETSQLHPTTHENERVQAINVPVRSRPTHHRSGSKGSRDASLSTEVPQIQIQVAGSPILVSPSGDDDDDTTAVAPTVVLDTSTIGIDNNKPALAPSSFSSSSESEEDDGDEADEEDDDDEQEEEELEQQNALRSAAGVEKISRHNKE
jgi:hypothetical protein